VRRNEITGLSVAVGGLAVLLIVLTLSNVVDIAQGIQIMITFVLVLVTAVYVRRTAEIAGAAREQAEAARQQADASARMAEEMANTRYDAFRPIIDIVEMPMEATETLKYAFQAKEGKVPDQIRCLLRNIGVGPALSVSSFIIGNDGQRRWDFGIIAVEEKTAEFRLSPQQIGDRVFLVAYYKDLYARNIESRREVTLENNGWKIHPVETQTSEEKEPQ
jgi:hypothetical protein